MSTSSRARRPVRSRLRAAGGAAALSLILGAAALPSAAHAFSAPTTLNSSSSWTPYDLATDAGGNVYAAEYGSNRVVKYSSSGAVLMTITGVSKPWGVAVSPVNGDIFVVSSINAQNWSGSGTVYRYNAAGVLQGTVASGLSSPMGATVDAAGNFYVAEAYGNGIRKYTPAGVEQAIGSFMSGLPTGSAPSDVAVDAAGNIYATDYIGSAVIKYNSAGVQQWRVDPLSRGGGITVDPSGRLYAVDHTGSQILQLNPATGATIRTIASATYSSNTNPWGVVISPLDGTMFTSDINNYKISAYAATLPDTTIVTGPSGTTNNATPSFTFTSTLSGSTFECSMDNGAWVACSASYTSGTLSSGTHTLRVRAVAPDGPDSTPASRTFTVDTTAPDTAIASGPSGLVSSSSATFTFSSAASDLAGFECRLDGGAWSACSSSGKSYAGMAEGAHTFEVRALDTAGNADGTPASRTFTVDTTAPSASITSGPSGLVMSNAATFTYSSAAGDLARFECRLDGGSWASCSSSGKSYSGLADGSHTFEVRAVDNAGNVGAVASTTFDVQPLATATTAPTLSGTPQAGQTLTVDPGAWSGTPSDVSVQWMRCDASGSSCVPIPGATGLSYTLTGDDVGSVVVPRITVTNAGGSTEVMVPGTTPVAAAPAAPAAPGAPGAGNGGGAGSGSGTGTGTGTGNGSGAGNGLGLGSGVDNGLGTGNGTEEADDAGDDELDDIDVAIGKTGMRLVSIKLTKGNKTAKVRIRVPKSGTVIMGRSKVVKVRATKSAKKAGIVSLSVKLSAKTVKQLSSKGKAKVRLLISFTPKGGKKKTGNVTVTIKKYKKAAAKKTTKKATTKKVSAKK